MTKGLLYVVYGEQCNLVAAHCIKYSREFTDLPIFILTNIKNNGSDPLWKGIGNVRFQYFDRPLSGNRQAKTTCIKYTPFDKTIYLDADSIIQKHGIEKLFNQINGNLLLNQNQLFHQGLKTPNIYLEAIKKFECDSPLRVYNGAFIGFEKTPIAEKFFDMWNKMWIDFGRNREMPCLAAALQKIDIDVVALAKGIFAPDRKETDAIIQHDYYQDFYRRIGLDRVVELTKQATKSTDFRFSIWE